MSFSANVKEELSKINIFPKEELIKAELYGYVLTIPMDKSNIVFLTENEYNINRLNKLLKTLGINYSIKMKGNNYAIEFKKNDLKLDFKENEETKKAIVRGAFLGSGWVTEPDSRYHLEINIKEERNRDKLIEIINSFSIEVKKLDRKYAYSIYIKDGEEISKLLALIGANSSVLKYEDIRVIKETKNNVNRKVNCETANLNKTVNAAVYQIQAIEKLKKENKFKKLPISLQEIAKLRQENPDATLTELGQMLSEPIRKIWGKS
ncbi:MAG: DNA-binding protein WhiA [Clostridia bacterium]|nr:DNA-binding protein WhiA [Clostridia bacterium]